MRQLHFNRSVLTVIQTAKQDECLSPRIALQFDLQYKPTDAQWC